jgi:tetratricopeptide (TPR) repeat protein
MSIFKTSVLLMVLAWPAPGFCSSLTNAEIFFEKGKVFFAHKDWARAAISFELAMQRDPANANALYYDALTYQQAGDLQRAKALYKHAMAVFPGTKAAAYSLVALKALEKHMASARQVETVVDMFAKPAPPVEKPPETPPAKPADPVQLLITRGVALQEDGRGNEAERFYRDALNQAEKGGQNDVRIADALQALSEYYVDIGSYGKACDLYRRELRIREFCSRQDPDAVATCMLRQVNGYIKDGDYSMAEDLLRKCVDTYQSQYDIADQHHKRTTCQRQKLVQAKSSLAAVLRVTNRANEAKNIEQEIKILSQPSQP